MAGHSLVKPCAGLPIGAIGSAQFAGGGRQFRLKRCEGAKEIEDLGDVLCGVVDQIQCSTDGVGRGSPTKRGRELKQAAASASITR